MFGFSKLALLLSHKIIIVAGTAFITLGGAGYLGVHYLTHTDQTPDVLPPAASVNSSLDKTTGAVSQKAKTGASVIKNSKSKPKSTVAKQPSSTKTPSTSSGGSSHGSPKTPVKTINTTNCLPSNPSIFETYFINDTNSQYLQTDSYVYTDKLYAGFQFAGLLNTINTKQYVVLAMDDSNWNGLTQSQLDWMNASPANMASVLGWQVITSCITYDGVNPTKDLARGTTKTVQTLNGPVTFTAGGGGGLGTFDNADVGIWDWFTSNGSVTIAGFVNPPTGH